MRRRCKFSIQRESREISAHLSIQRMELQQNILQALNETGSIGDTSVLFPDLSEGIVSSALRSLESKEMIVFSQRVGERWSLNTESRDIVKSGSYEARLFRFLVQSMGELKISDIAVRMRGCELLLNC